MSVTTTPERRFVMERHVSIGIEELRFFEFECPKCHNGFILDMGGKETRFPEQCPSCGQTWNSFTGQPVKAFDGYKNFYNAFLSAEAFKARFRVNDDA